MNHPRWHSLFAVLAALAATTAASRASTATGYFIPKSIAYTDDIASTANATFDAGTHDAGSPATVYALPAEQLPGADALIYDGLVPLRLGNTSGQADIRSGVKNALQMSGQSWGPNTTTYVDPNLHYSHLHFLATAYGADFDGTITINYSDSTSASLPFHVSQAIGPSDNSAPGESETDAVDVPFYYSRVAGDPAMVRVNSALHVFHESINLDSSKTISSIVLPDDRTDPGARAYALGVTFESIDTPTTVSLEAESYTQTSGPDNANSPGGRLFVLGDNYGLAGFNNSAREYGLYDNLWVPADGEYQLNIRYASGEASHMRFSLVGSGGGAVLPKVSLPLTDAAYSNYGTGLIVPDPANSASPFTYELTKGQYQVRVDQWDNQENLDRFTLSRDGDIPSTVGTVSGVITRTGGSASGALAGARIIAIQPGKTITDATATQYTAVTDANGAYSLKVPEASGTYGVTVVAPSYAAQTFNVTVSSGSPNVTQNATLAWNGQSEAESYVSGYGEGLHYADNLGSTFPSGNVTSGWGYVGDLNTYDFVDIPVDAPAAGLYTLTVRASWKGVDTFRYIANGWGQNYLYTPANTNLNAMTNVATGIQLALKQGANLVRVVCTGLSSTNGPAAGSGINQDALILASAGGSIATIHGKVTDSVTGVGIPYVRVTNNPTGPALGTAPAAGANTPGYADTLTDSNGNYSIAVPSGGSITLTAVKGNFTQATATVTATGDHTQDFALGEPIVSTPIALPYGYDWIASEFNGPDQTADHTSTTPASQWAYIGENLPGGYAAGGVTDYESPQTGLQYNFPDSTDGVNNVMLMNGQALALSTAHYVSFSFLASTLGGASPLEGLQGTLTLHYATGSDVVAPFVVSNWFNGQQIVDPARTGAPSIPTQYADIVGPPTLSSPSAIARVNKAGGIDSRTDGNGFRILEVNVPVDSTRILKTVTMPTDPGGIGVGGDIFVFAATATSLDTPVAKGTITGNVYDNSANPVAGATVTAGGVSAVTDGSGFYSIDVPPATYDVTASDLNDPDGVHHYADSVQHNITVTSNNTTSSVDFTLQPAARITGTVADDHGIPGTAKITVSGQPQTIADPSTGVYTVYVPSPGTYTVTIAGHYLPVLTPATTTVSANGTTVTQNFTVHRINVFRAVSAPTVDGTITDSVWATASPYALNDPLQIDAGAANWTGTSDYSSTVRFLYDDNYLYYAYDVTDDSPLQGVGVNTFLRDTAELFFGTDPTNPDRSNTLTDWQLITSAASPNDGTNDGGTSYNLYEKGVLADPVAGQPTGMPAHPAANGLDVRAAAKSGGYTLEGKIPWGVLNVGTPNQNDVWDMDFGADDSDNGSGAQDTQFSVTRNAAFSGPGNWASAVFLGVGTVTALPGDADKNGVVNAADAALTLKVAGGLLSSADPSFSYTNAHVTTNASITVADAVKIMRKTILGSPLP